MIIHSIEVYTRELRAHDVPETRIQETVAKIQAITDKQRRLLRQVSRAKTYRSANLALKQSFKMAGQIDSIMTDVLTDIKHEHLKYNHRKTKKNG